MVPISSKNCLRWIDISKERKFVFSENKIGLAWTVLREILKIFRRTFAKHLSITWRNNKVKIAMSGTKPCNRWKNY